MSAPRVVLNQKASKLASKGQAWFFGDDFQDGEQPDGIVRISSERGFNFGLGFHSSQSRIRVPRSSMRPAVR